MPGTLAEHLQGQGKTFPEAGGVHHAQHPLHSGARQRSLETVGSNALFTADGCKGIGARKIYQHVFRMAQELSAAQAYRNTGEIRHLLGKTRQPIKE